MSLVLLSILHSDCEMLTLLLHQTELVSISPSYQAIKTSHCKGSDLIEASILMSCCLSGPKVKGFGSSGGEVSKAHHGLPPGPQVEPVMGPTPASPTVQPPGSQAGARE